MSKEDLLQFQGSISRVLGRGLYEVTLDENGKKVQSTLSGRMKKYFIRVVLGDKVTIGISPYDVDRGIILYRQK